jgi:hypothetical protein
MRSDANVRAEDSNSVVNMEKAVALIPKPANRIISHAAGRVIIGLKWGATLAALAPSVAGSYPERGSICDRPRRIETRLLSGMKFSRG